MKRCRLICLILVCLAHGLKAQTQKNPTPTFRVDVDTVFVKAAVMDSRNRYVTNLNKDSFRIYEDKVLQTIIHFSSISAPVGIGIIFDVSSSMGFHGNIRVSKNWFTNSVKKINPNDEFFLVTFNNKVTMVESFTDNGGDLQYHVATVKTGGSTALYDSIYLGLSKVKQSKNEKKALVVYSDGEENSSRYNRKDVLEFLKESDVPIYCYGLAGPEGYGGGVLRDIVRITGGRFGAPIDVVLTELRNQYLLGYVPINQSRDGKWRKINVKLEMPPGYPPLMVRAKEGYLAPR
jgi:Ca-activated chloride channel family protein